MTLYLKMLVDKSILKEEEGWCVLINTVVFLWKRWLPQEIFLQSNSKELAEGMLSLRRQRNNVKLLVISTGNGRELQRTSSF